MRKPLFRRSFAPKVQASKAAEDLLLPETDLCPNRSQAVTDGERYADDVRRMAEALDAGGFPGLYARGFALAHQQVSRVPGRFFVVRSDIALKHFGGHRVFWNPQILSRDGLHTSREACLSHPYRTTRKVERFETVKVSWADEKGAEQVWTLKGLAAIIFQHEVDHCEGKSIWQDRVGV